MVAQSNLTNLDDVETLTNRRGEPRTTTDAITFDDDNYNWTNLPEAPRFPPESELDNIEYKWKLTDLTEWKFGSR